MPHPKASNSTNRAYFEYETAAGSVLEDSVLIMNSGDRTLDLVIYAADARTATNGGISIGTGWEQSAEASGQWITLERNRVTIAEGETATIPFTLRLPDTLPAGEYAAMIVAQEANTAVNESDGVFGANFVPRVGVTVLASVLSAPLQSELQISTLSAETDEVQSITIDMANIGNDGIPHSEGLFTVHDTAGFTVYEYAFDLGYFLAGDTLRQIITIEPPLPPADYTATVIMRADTGQMATKSADLAWAAPEQLREINAETETDTVFTLTPFQMALIAICTLVLIIVVLLIWQNRRQKALLDQLLLQRITNPNIEQK